MESTQITLKDKTAVLSLNRNKSNAINLDLLTELSDKLHLIENDATILGLIITGKEDFFSAGLHLIELFHYNENDFKEFLQKYFSLIIQFTSFKKPAIAAINGHSPAAGCILSLCCDYRVMAEGKYVIGLNDITLGLPVTANFFKLFAFWLGQAKAYQYSLEGKLFGPEEALQAGLVNELVRKQSILTACEKQMQKFVQLNTRSWQKSKLNLRADLVEQLKAGQSTAIEDIAAYWWKPHTRAILKTIISNLSP